MRWNLLAFLCVIGFPHPRLSSAWPYNHFNSYYLNKGNNWPPQRSVLKLAIAVQTLSRTPLRTRGILSWKQPMRTTQCEGKSVFCNARWWGGSEKLMGWGVGLETQLGIWLEILEELMRYSPGQEAGQRQFGSPSLRIIATQRKWMDAGRLASLSCLLCNHVREKQPLICL